MALAGLSYASIVVSSFSRAQNRVLQMGFADDMNTYVMISGMMIFNSYQSCCIISNSGLILILNVDNNYF